MAFPFWTVVGGQSGSLSPSDQPVLHFVDLKALAKVDNKSTSGDGGGEPENSGESKHGRVLSETVRRANRPDTGIMVFLTGNVKHYFHQPVFGDPGLRRDLFKNTQSLYPDL